MAKLLLSGWAQPANALALLEPGAQQFDYSDTPPSQVMQKLAALGPVDSVIAWSLGGQLALHAIAEGVIKPKHLTLIGVPYQMVSCESIKGMDPLTFAQFHDNYQANPARTKTRFHSLVAKGDTRHETVLRALTHHPEVENTDRWLPWLHYLAAAPAGSRKLHAAPPTLIIHGTADAIVPVSQAALLANALPASHVQLWENVGHAPHLHDAEKLRRAIAAHRDGVL